MAFKHTIPPSRPDMGRWGTENTGCCFEPMRDILPTTQKHIYILFHNNHFQSKNAAWPIIENTPLVPHLKKNLFHAEPDPSVFFRSQWAAISLADSLSCCTSLVKILTRDFLIRTFPRRLFSFFSPVSSACSISYAAYDNTNFSVHGSKRFTRGLQRAFPYIHVAAPETEASDGTLLRLSVVLPYSIFDKKSGRFPFRFCYEDR